MNKIKKWFIRQYTKLKMYWKMWKSLHTYPENWDTWQKIHEWNGDTQIGFKHNPYYFMNMGDIIPINTEYEKKDNIKNMEDEYVFIPFPVYKELYKLMNELRMD